MMRILQGSLSGKKILTPKTEKTRPTQGVIREAVFNILQSSIVGAKMLDLFAGSGAMGFEAISRGASLCFFVDQSSLCTKTMQKTAKALGVEEQTKIYRMDIFSAVKILDEPVDVIYMDPPYSMKDLPEKMIRLFETHLKRSLLQKGGHIFLELPKNILFSPPNTFTTKKRTYGNTVILQLDRA